jgi:hypothetical protein
MMRYHQLLRAILLITATVASLSYGCQNNVPWVIYDNKNYGYTVSYPKDWSVNEPFQNRQLVAIKSPDTKQTISVVVTSDKNMTLDQQVNFYMTTQRNGSYYYKLVSSQNIEIRGVDARQLETVYQDQSNSPRLFVKELYMINRGGLYIVRVSTEVDDPDMLSSLNKRVLDSFKFN